MKSTVVPAQITTVEDKIAGNLSMSQLLLFSFPVFGSAVIYAILPPNMGSATYKLVLIGALTLVFGILGIRIKGKVLAFWLIVLFRYNVRPRYYVYSKASTYHRLEAETKQADKIIQEIIADPNQSKFLLEPLKLVDRVYLESLVGNPAANLNFVTTKNGGLHVRIAEVE